MELDAECNLLFAAIAIEEGFLDARQLVEATVLLTASQRETLLSDFLCDLGWISAAAKTRVDSLVELKRSQVQQTLQATYVAPMRPNLGIVSPPKIAPEPAVRAAAVERRYGLISVHASGGIGRIWLAHDSQLGRDVAIKELLPETLGNATSAARFLREARITGQLEHPGVVPVYELARHPENNQPFYSMRFVKGRTLTEATETYHRQRQSGQADDLMFAELLSALGTVCQTVAYAHSRRIIHRDLKGENVILGDFGEVLVLDWGLAKVIGEQECETAGGLDEDLASHLTQQGQIVGTPAYMAPEQVAGRQDEIDERTDIYGLGAIFYQILTGQPPFVGSTTMEVLHKVRIEEPLPPREVWNEVPVGLEALCLRALAKDSAARFGSASELAREVQGWQDQQRRKAEVALRRSQERFELAVAGSQDGLWDWDLLTDAVYFSPRWKSMIGYEDHEIAHTLEEWDRRLHPDERERVIEANMAHIEGRTTHYEYEYRLRHKDGSYRWILARGVALRDASGKAYRMAGSHVDVTARKAMEEALRESQKMDHSIIAALPLAAVLLDSDGSVRACNALAQQILRIREDETTGRLELDPTLILIREDRTPLDHQALPHNVALRTGSSSEKMIVGISDSADGTSWFSASAEPLMHRGDTRPYAVVACFETLRYNSRE